MPGSTTDDEGVEWVLLSCPHSGTQWEDTVKYCYGGGQAPIPSGKAQQCSLQKVVIGGKEGRAERERIRRVRRAWSLRPAWPTW